VGFGHLEGRAEQAQASCFRVMEENDEREVLTEGQDYYFEDGLMVLTARYLLRRGYCCEQGCRHCPYGFSDEHHDVPASNHLPH
jgi:Family of unknown function (DUF5522)